MTTTPHQNRDVNYGYEAVRIDDGRVGKANLSIICSGKPSKYIVYIFNEEAGKELAEYILCSRVTRLQDSAIVQYPNGKDMRYL